MKSKTFFLAFLLFVLSAQLSAAQSPFLIKTGDKVEVNITRQATKADLMDLKKELQEKHQIQVDFTSMAFDKKGHLKGIAMSVKAPNGSSGTCHTDRVKNKRGAYFMVDKTPGAKVAFQIGVGKKQ